MTSSRAGLYGMATLAAVAAHGAVVALLWRAPALPAAAPAVRVQLIERPAPVVAASAEAEPAAVTKAAPQPEPPPVRKPRPEPKPAPVPEPKSRPAPPTAKPAEPARPAPESTTTPTVASRPGPASAAAPPAAAPKPELALYCPHRPPPRYPPAARRLGQEGVVELLVELSATGAVMEVAVVRSSGSAGLDRAAITAVRGWRCKPARIGGVAVAARAQQRIRFSLR